MKPLLLLSALLLFCISDSLSNAVLIVNASNKTTLQLKSSTVQAEVNNQVAIVTSSQVFFNQFDSTVLVKYAFPLYEDASAVSLRWKVNGIWHSASFSPSLPDTTLPGSGSGSGGIDIDLQTFLGETPLYFNLEDSIPMETYITFELTYVQLLHYAYNEVSFDHPNDYSLIQTTPLDTQSLSVHIYSDRTIVGIDMVSHTPTSISYSSTDANVLVEILNESADADYHLEYSLNPDELGLFSFSTYLPDSMNTCDSVGNGFFAFIVEPDPGDTIIIQKVFTLIIDRSGSMGGDKIVQAKEAAAFVVNNLNLGDRFNIIDFDDQVTSLFPDHVDVSLPNQTAALNYINALTADGSTNISGAFGVAVPQFAFSNPDVANIIIFMTDGQATAGITGTDEILDYVEGLVSNYEVEGLIINTFGIGYDVNTSLLSQLASENDGIASFFSAGDLVDVITTFYSAIQNPVLINTSMTFDPSLVYETYPDPLPDLYKGHQLIVAGRYDEPGWVNVTFSGFKYGDSISYQYAFYLTDSLIEQNLFLTKLWAIEKINQLMSDYYALDPSSVQAEDLKKNIIDLSLCYSVISPFTSFVDPGGGTVSVETISGFGSTAKVENYPNPFRDLTTIHFTADIEVHQIVPVVILDLHGRIIRIIEVFVNGKGDYTTTWDGRDESRKEVPAGLYPYYIKIGDKMLQGVMEKF